MKIYRIPGMADDVEIAPEHEEKFLASLKAKNVTPTLISDESEKSKDSKKEKDLSQKQSTKTKQKSGFDDLAPVKLFKSAKSIKDSKQHQYMLNNEVVDIANKDIKSFTAAFPGAKPVVDADKNIDTFARGELSNDMYSKLSVDGGVGIADQLLQSINENPWKIEKNLANTVNELFKDEVDENGNQRIRAIETKAGKDAIEILYGNQEEGEGTPYDLGGFMDWVSGEKRDPVDRKTIAEDIVFDIKFNTNKAFQEDFVNNHIDNIIPDDAPVFAKDYGKRASEYQAQFYNAIDKNLIESGQKPSWMSDEDFTKYQTTGELPKQFQTPIGQAEIPSFEWHDKAGLLPGEVNMPDYANRLYGKKFYSTEEKGGDSFMGPLVKKIGSAVGQTLSGLTADINKADATGSITLPDGSKVSYKKLYELSKYKKSKIQAKNDELEIQLTHEEFPLENSKKVIKNKLLNADIPVEAYEDHEQYADQVLMSYGHEGKLDAKVLGIKKEIDLLEADRMIVGDKQVDIKTDKQKKEAELRLKELRGQYDEIFEYKGYEEFYDKNTGQRINYSKGEWLDQGDGTEINNLSGVKRQIISDEEIKQLADDYTDKDGMRDELFKRFIKLKSAIRLVVDNEDIIDSEQKKIMKALGAAVDLENDGHDNDLRQMKRALEKGKPFDLEGLGKHALTGMVEVDNPFLSQMAGTSEPVQIYNQALKDYVAMTRAYHLNVDLYKAKQESWGHETWKLTRSAFTGNYIADSDLEDDIYHSFSDWMENDLEIVLPDHVAEWGEKRTRASGTARAYLDSGSEFGSSMMPLITSIVVLKKIAPVTGSRNMLVKFADKMTKSWTSPTAKFVATDVLAPGLFTTAEWHIAEKYVGENVFGWKAHTLTRDEQGKVDWSTGVFPFAMGAGGNLWGRFLQYTKPKIRANETYGAIFKYIENTSPHSPVSIKGAAQRTAQILAPPTAAIASGFGQGVSGTALLQISEGMRLATRDLLDSVDPNSREGKRRIEEWNSWKSTDHLAGQFILMSALGWAGLPGQWRKNMTRDALILSKNRGEMETKAHNELELDNFSDKRVGEVRNEDGSYKPSALKRNRLNKEKENNKNADEAKRKIEEHSKEINEIEARNKKLQDKRKGKTEKSRDKISEELGENQTKIEALKENLKKEATKARELERANENLFLNEQLLLRYNNRLHARNLAEKNGTQGTLLLENYIKNDRFNRFANGTWTTEDLIESSRLNAIDLEMVLHRAGIEIGTPQYNFYKDMFSVLHEALNEVKGRDIMMDVPDAREFLKSKLDLHQNEQRIEGLETSMKEAKGVSKTEIKERISELKEENKNIIEKVKQSKENLETEFRRRFKAEMVQNKIDAADADVTMNSKVEKGYLAEMAKLKKEGLISEAQYKEAIKQEGFYHKGTNTIYMNETAALKSRNLGIGMHEIIHRILRDVLKHNVLVYEGQVYSKYKLNKLKKSDKKLYDKVIKSGVAKREISKQGVTIINNFLSKLKYEDRKVLEKELEDRGYKREASTFTHKDGRTYTLESLSKLKESNPEMWKNFLTDIQLGDIVEVKGKKRRKEEYYEEYVAIYGELLRNKRLKTDYDTGRKLGKIIHPILLKFGVGKNWYRFDLNKTKSDKAGGDLFDMVKTYATEGLTKEIIELTKKTKSEDLIIGGKKYKTPDYSNFSNTKDMMLTLDKFNRDSNQESLFKTNEQYKNSKGYDIIKDFLLHPTTKNLYDSGMADLLPVELGKKYEGSQVEVLDNLILGPSAVKTYIRNTKGVTRESFLEDAKKELKKRFLKNYNYEKNPSFFGWLYTKSPVGMTILEHVRGDAGMAKGKGRKHLGKEISYDVNIGDGSATYGEMFRSAPDNNISRIDNQVIMKGVREVEAEIKLRQAIGMNKNTADAFLKSTADMFINKSMVLPDVRTKKVTANLRIKEDGKTIRVEEGIVDVDIIKDSAYKKYIKAKENLDNVKETITKEYKNKLEKVFLTNESLYNKLKKERDQKLSNAESEVSNLMHGVKRTLTIRDVKTNKEALKKDLTHYEYQDLLVKEGSVIKKGDLLLQGFKETLKEQIKKELPDLAEKYKQDVDFELFLENHFKAVFKLLDGKTLINWEREVGGKAQLKKYPNAQRLFSVFNKRTGKKKLIQNYIDAELLEPSALDKSAQGVLLYDKAGQIDIKKAKAYFMGIDMMKELGYELSPTAIEARKQVLFDVIKEKLAFDATYQVLTMEKVDAARNRVLEMTERQKLDNEMVMVMEAINRESGMMFSKANFKDIKNAVEQMYENKMRFEDMFELQADGTYKILDGKKLSKGTIEKLAELYAQGKIGNDPGLNAGIKLAEKNGEQWAKEVAPMMKETYNKDSKKIIEKIQRDLEIMANEGLLTVDLLRYPGFLEGMGFHLRYMNSAARVKYPKWSKVPKEQKQKLYDEGKVNNIKDGYLIEGENFISAPHYEFKQKLTKLIEKNESKPEIREIAEAAEVMNKSASLFKKVEDIQNKPDTPKYRLPNEKGKHDTNSNKRWKDAEIAKLQPRIEKANTANKRLNKHIHDTFYDALKKKKISLESYARILESQTNIVKGFRGLTTLDLIYTTNGSQAIYKYTKAGEVVYTNKSTRTENKKTVDNEINIENADYKQAVSFYKLKGKGKGKNWRELTKEEAIDTAIDNLISKGEHIAPNANTMMSHIKLGWEYANNKITKRELNSKMDALLETHSQMHASKYICDIVDMGGKNNSTGFHRIKFLDQFGHKNNNYIDNLISPDGKSYYEVLLKKELTKWERETKEEAIKKKEKVNREIVAQVSLSYSKKGKKQGMATFDFDDTLARTKSGIRTNIPNLDGSPKPGRKVVFLAGGAGSGKGNVVKKLELENQGFKIVNQDISLEWLKKNNGLPENMNDLTKEQRSTLGKLGHQARGIAKRKMMKFKGKGDGVVVDGTGASMKNMEKLVAEFKDKGYDVSMLFVETSIETALARNKARKERSLLDIIVKKNHESVQNNKQGFEGLFGDRFMQVKTDNLTIDSPMPKELIKKMNNFVSGYERLRLDAAEFAERGKEILDRGGKFDFSEFDKVVEGTEGPHLQEAIKKANKYGTENMFVLTARPPGSAKAIQEFLKTMGLDIPLKNITGLGNSTGEAKALWMLEKFKEGYNDMYFVDDVLGNVKAVKQVLEQLDIKSKVVQADINFSRTLNREINDMIERKKGVPSEKVFTRVGRDKGIGKWDLYVPPSAEDFKGLMYKMLGKGRQGDADMAFMKKALFTPFAKGIRDWTSSKQRMVEEYATLKKKTKDVNLTKEIKGTEFTNDTAVRMYLWEKAGYEAPGMTTAERKVLLDHMTNNPKLVAFAEVLSSITRLKESYSEPGEYWMIDNIASDLNSITRKNLRKRFINEWIENKNEIFSKENLNKIEAVWGKGYRESLENVLHRMETGTNRLTGRDAPVNRFYDWMNGSVGAIMFWNTRSALLQTISTVNFLDYGSNNIFSAAKAFANVPQFCKDFSTIFNSDMLRQRRSGLEIDVSANELTNAFEKGNKNPKAILRYLLQQGFTPTRVADSFAIATGGATFYRNRINKYIKEGMSKAKAKEKAWLDFQEKAEETQQSSRPDLISQQQAGPLGRVILPFQNTPMQMTRLMKKGIMDLWNRRRNPGETQLQSDMSNISKVLYYGAIQNVLFYTLQSGMMWALWGDDKELVKSKEFRVANGAFDSLLRGTGIYGAGVATLKNMALQWHEQRQKGFGQQDFGKVAIEAINLSPPLGAKVRKVYGSIKTFEYNKGVGKELPLFSIENPNLNATAGIIEAITNAPVARTLNKMNNLEEIITGNHEVWQKTAMAMGWNRWDLGIVDEELKEAKTKAKEKRKETKKLETADKKKKEKEELEKQGFKTIRCSGTSSSGKQCGLTTFTKEKTWKCMHHMDFKDGMDRDNDGIKEYRCTATTSSKKRCKNKTENKNKKCYAHQ